MNAEELLAAVRIESAQRLLIAIRQPNNLTTGLRPLDAHLSTVSTPPGSPLRPGDVIEIQGPAASGKSQLIYHMIATCILPSESGSNSLGGWNKAAILFDTDGKFNASKFHRLLLARINRLAASLERSTQAHAMSLSTVSPAEELASQCLARLHVFRPSSSLQLAASLLNLSNYHASSSSMTSQEIGLLAVDSLSAFHWEDKFAQEQSRDRGNLGSAAKNLRQQPLQYVLDAIQDLQKTHGSVAFLTNWGLNPISEPTTGSSGTSYPTFKQHLRPFPSVMEVPRQQPTDLDLPRGPTNTAAPVAGSTAALDSGTVQLPGAPINVNPQPLRLAHQITLHPVLTAPRPTDSAATDTADISRSSAGKRTAIRVTVRTSGQPTIGYLSLSIAEDGLSDALYS